MAVGLPPALGNSLCKKSLKYFSYSEALLVEGYQNGARHHLALRQLLISLVPLRSVISRWVINESSADSVTDNSSCAVHPPLSVSRVGPLMGWSSCFFWPRYCGKHAFAVKGSDMWDPFPKIRPRSGFPDCQS